MVSGCQSKFLNFYMLAIMPGASKHIKLYIYFIHAVDLAECKKNKNLKISS